MTVFISMWLFLLRARYVRVLSSEFKDRFPTSTQKHPDALCQPWWNHRNNIFSNQIKQMMAQKNRMDPPITDTYLPESMVDFELLWRCISKIQNTSHVASYMKDFSNLN